MRIAQEECLVRVLVFLLWKILAAMEIANGVRFDSRRRSFREI